MLHSRASCADPDPVPAGLPGRCAAAHRSAGSLNDRHDPAQGDRGEDQRGARAAPECALSRCAIDVAMTALDTRPPRRAAPRRTTIAGPRSQGQAWPAEGAAAMFDAFMAAAPAIAFVKDPDGRYLHANRQLLEQFGDRLGSDWFGRTDADIWPADIAALVHASDVVALAADAPIQVTQLMPIGDTQVPILVTKFPIHTPQGVLLGGIGLDITHERVLAVVAARHAHQRALIADTLAHLPVQATSEATAQMICRQVASRAGRLDRGLRLW